MMQGNAVPYHGRLLRVFRFAKYSNLDVAMAVSNYNVAIGEDGL
jgi:hypothetical protein